MLLSFLLLPLYNFPTKGQIVRWLEGTVALPVLNLLFFARIPQLPMDFY